MFEAALLDKLTSDGTLTGYLSTFGGYPAIFSESTPEEVEETDIYLVFRIDRLSDENLAVQAFNVYLDIYARSSTRATVRAASHRLELLLDHVTLTDPSNRFDNIRMYFFSGGPVPEGDSQKIHHNLQFTARAGRKAWAAQLT